MFAEQSCVSDEVFVEQARQAARDAGRKCGYYLDQREAAMRGGAAVAAADPESGAAIEKRAGAVTKRLLMRFEGRKGEREGGGRWRPGLGLREPPICGDACKVILCGDFLFLLRLRRCVKGAPRLDSAKAVIRLQKRIFFLRMRTETIGLEAGRESFMIT